MYSNTSIVLEKNAKINYTFKKNSVTNLEGTFILLLLNCSPLILFKRKKMEIMSTYRDTHISHQHKYKCQYDQELYFGRKIIYNSPK